MAKSMLSLLIQFSFPLPSAFVLLGSMKEKETASCVLYPNDRVYAYKDVESSMLNRVRSLRWLLCVEFPSIRVEQRMPIETGSIISHQQPQ